MVTLFTGFSRANDLSENTSDRQAVTNLISSLNGIVNDIDLFANNTKNTSSLDIKLSEYNSSTGQIIIVNDDIDEARARSNVFTNRDIVEIVDTSNNTLVIGQFYIKDSNAIDTFNLSTKADLSDTFTFNPSGNFRLLRKNTVTTENLLRLGLSDFYEGETGLDDAENFERISDLEESFDFLLSELEEKKLAKDTRFSADSNLSTNLTLTFEGAVIVADPLDSIQSNGGIDVDSPGVYVTDPTSEVDNISKLRSFSSKSNPWIKVGTEISTDSTEVSIGEIIFENGITIDGISPVTSSGTILDDLTHKVRVKINGIDYYLCLNLS